MLTARFIEACTFGAALAVTAFFFGLFLTDLAHSLQYTSSDIGRILDKQWASTLISPHTRVLTFVVVGCGAAIGLLAALIRRYRRVALISTAAISFFAIPPLYCMAVLIIEEGTSCGKAAMQGGALGLAVLVVYSLTMIPCVIAQSFLLEWGTRPDREPRQVAHLVVRGCVWAASVLLLLAACTQLYLPRRPDSRLERLMLQVEGKRCDERRGPQHSFHWQSITVDVCREDAVFLLGAMGPEAKAAVPLLVSLVTTLRDVDTGDGFSVQQSGPAWALAEIGDPGSIGHLIQALQMDDRPGARVGRRAIALALGKFGPRARDAIGPLTKTIEACADDHCRQYVVPAATGALTKITSGH